jgi:hypothetical protein
MTPKADGNQESFGTDAVIRILKANPEQGKSKRVPSKTGTAISNVDQQY